MYYRNVKKEEFLSFQFAISMILSQYQESCLSKLYRNFSTSYIQQFILLLLVISTGYYYTYSYTYTYTKRCLLQFYASYYEQFSFSVSFLSLLKCSSSKNVPSSQQQLLVLVLVLGSITQQQQQQQQQQQVVEDYTTYYYFITITMIF